MIAAPFTRGPIDGARLREARWRAGLTQFELCARTGLAPRTLAAAEAGLASRKSLERICAVLRLSPEVIAPGLVPVPAPEPPPPVDPRPEFRIAATQGGAR